MSNSDLFNNKLWFVTLLLAVFMAGCDDRSSFSFSDVFGAPLVSTTVPENDTTDVFLNTKITVVFSKEMDPLTITTVTFTVEVGGTPIAGTVSYTGVTAIFTPSVNLLIGTTYVCTITGGDLGAKDLAGSPLAEDFTWSFTTGATSDNIAPQVSSTEPPNPDPGGAVNKRAAAVFSEAMDPLTITTATFTVTKMLPLPVTPIAGTVTYAGVTAVFTPPSDFTSDTTYECKITTGAQDLAANPLAADYTWQFTTGPAVDATVPRVISTDPASLATNVAVNKRITATFSETMNPLTTTIDTFRVNKVLPLPITLVKGTVICTGVTTIFKPLSNLEANTTYECKIASGALGVKDLAGNPMAANYTWNFTTEVAPETIPPTVTSVSPAAGALNVAINTNINANFSESMNPLTITTVTFTVTDKALIPVLGKVTYAGTTAIFTPSSALVGGDPYDCKIKGGAFGAKDLAGNPLAGDKDWQFTTGTNKHPKVPLNSAALFGGSGSSAGMTNQGTLTVIHGNITTTAPSTLITGFHDTGANVYTESPLNKGAVNGTIYTATAPPGSDPGVVAARCLLDTQVAFNYLKALPFDYTSVKEIGNTTLASGVYYASTGEFAITLGDLTLDAKGDPDAVWVFQAPSALTVGAPGFPRNVILSGGAQAKNVYWQVDAAARIENRCQMVGTIIAYAGVTISTAGELGLTTLAGRALALNASVTVVNTVITVPGQ